MPSPHGIQSSRPWDESVAGFETMVPFLVNGGSVLEHVVPLKEFDLHSTTPKNTFVEQQRFRARGIIVHYMKDYNGMAIF